MSQSLPTAPSPQIMRQGVHWFALPAPWVSFLTWGLPLPVEIWISTQIIHNGGIDIDGLWGSLRFFTCICILTRSKRRISSEIEIKMKSGRKTFDWRAARKVHLVSFCLCDRPLWQGVRSFSSFMSYKGSSIPTLVERRKDESCLGVRDWLQILTLKMTHQWPWNRSLSYQLWVSSSAPRWDWLYSPPSAARADTDLYTQRA